MGIPRTSCEYTKPPERGFPSVRVGRVCLIRSTMVLKRSIKTSSGRLGMSYSFCRCEDKRGDPILKTFLRERGLVTRARCSESSPCSYHSRRRVSCEKRSTRCVLLDKLFLAVALH